MARRKRNNPRMIGRCEYCGRTFRKPSHLSRYCDHPVCRQVLKEEQRKRGRKYYSVRKSLLRRGVRRYKGPRRRCRADEVLGYRSPKCDGWIHNGNIQICEHCQELRNRMACGYMFDMYNEFVPRSLLEQEYEEREVFDGGAL